MSISKEAWYVLSFGAEEFEEYWDVMQENIVQEDLILWPEWEDIDRQRLNRWHREKRGYDLFQ